MKNTLRVAAMLIAGVSPLAVPTASAETPGAPVIIENYYKLVPGGTKEWRALYRKNHYPILQQWVKEGLLKSVKLFERRFHAAKPAWDYKVVLVWRDWAALEQARGREPEVTRSLYPNKDDHDRQENRRWEITAEHWDDVLNELPIE